MKWFR